MPALSRRSCSLPLHRGSEHRRSPFRRECFPRCFILGIRYFSVVWRVAVIATSCEDKRPLQSIRPVRLDHVLTLAPFPPPAPPPPRRSLLSLVPIHRFALLTACFRTSISPSGSGCAGGPVRAQLPHRPRCAACSPYPAGSRGVAAPREQLRACAGAATGSTQWRTAQSRRCSPPLADFSTYATRTRRAEPHSSPSPGISPRDARRSTTASYRAGHVPARDLDSQRSRRGTAPLPAVAATVQAACSRTFPRGPALARSSVCCWSGS